MIDTDDKVYEQIKLILAINDSSVVEATLEAAFVRHLKDIVALKQSPFSQ